MVNVGKLWGGRRRDDGEGFEGVVALAPDLTVRLRARRCFRSQVLVAAA